MRYTLAVACLALLTSAACGGSGGGTPTAPSPNTAAVIVSILGDRGSQSFSPNQSSQPAL